MAEAATYPYVTHVDIKFDPLIRRILDPKHPTKLPAMVEALRWVSASSSGWKRAA